MKLRNKQTGEIIELELGNYKNPTEKLVLVVNHEPKYMYNSLAELNEEWEDYEEPKDFYIVEQRGIVGSRYNTGDEYVKMFKKIGNYFETEEEAEKAVEKLKAWKRLKDKGFMFCGTDCINKNNVIYFEFGERPLTQSEADEAERELEICFGGEE